MDPSKQQQQQQQAYPAQGYENPPPYFSVQQPNTGAAPYPPGPGWNPQQAQQQPGFAPAPAHGSTVIVQPMTTPVNRVVLVGGCPTCHAGLLEDSFGCCAIFLAIFFFPIGILCCLAMREKRCTNCGSTF